MIMVRLLACLPPIVDWFLEGGSSVCSIHLRIYCQYLTQNDTGGMQEEGNYKVEERTVRMGAGRESKWNRLIVQIKTEQGPGRRLHRKGPGHAEMKDRFEFPELI